MIELQDKKDCCGCSACVQRCPKLCIKMKEDEEGFLYPVVDSTICIDCGLCEKVCPVINQSAERKPLNVYAAKNYDDEIRWTSSSGGVFTLLAYDIIDKGGVVFGASFNEHWEVAHSYTETREGVATFRGSKYVQSIIGNTFKQAEGFLKQGREVLFSGTPCQIAALKAFLRKDYENLITVDFICHGAPSPGVLRWHIGELIAKVARRSDKKYSFVYQTIPNIPKPDALASEAGYTIKGIRFRDKCKGWKKFSFVLNLSKATADGERNSVSFSYTLDRDPYLRGFLKDLYLRPSCHYCPSKAGKSCSDITLADFWGYFLVDKSFDDNKGISAVIVNTEKGSDILKSLNIDKREASYNFLCKDNPSINKSTQPNEKRELFYKSKEKSFKNRVIELCGNNYKNIIKSEILYLMQRIGFKK